MVGDRLLELVLPLAVVVIAGGAIVLVFALVRRRERSEALIYAALGDIASAAAWRGLFNVRARCAFFTRQCDLRVVASLPAMQDMTRFIAAFRPAFPPTVRIALDLVTLDQGRFVITFFGSRERAPTPPADVCSRPASVVVSADRAAEAAGAIGKSRPVDAFARG